jgi:hypothetical protein
MAATGTYTPSAIFSTKFTAGIDSRYNEQRIINPAEFDIVSGDNAGSIQRFNRDYTVVTLEYAGTISYPRQGTVTSNFTFGAQGFREETSIVEAFGETFALPGTEDLGEAATVTANENRAQIFNRRRRACTGTRRWRFPARQRRVEGAGVRRKGSADQPSGAMGFSGLWGGGCPDCCRTSAD